AAAEARRAAPVRTICFGVRTADPPVPFTVVGGLCGQGCGEGEVVRVAHPADGSQRRAEGLRELGVGFLRGGCSRRPQR
ncbi:hypothetical protein, partial [Micrococcus sp. F3Y]|uniref:hypothetical protein n=1 Tax=Micrococcus sp. F3Y TaxID=3402627 RepID=UPI003AF8EEFB